MAVNINSKIQICTEDWLQITNDESVNVKADIVMNIPKRKLSFRERMKILMRVNRSLKRPFTETNK